MQATEYAFPFDAVEYEKGYDREYFADDFARYFRAFISSGIIADGGNIANALQVVANDDMTTTLKKGNLIIDGYRYELTKDMTFNHTAADGVLDRIDRISITLDTAEREMYAILREGQYSYQPIAPQCRRTSEYIDYVVADIRIVKGATKITQQNITDTRLSTELCGVAFPFWKLDTGPFFAQLNSFYREFVEKSDASYAEFRDMAQTAYDSYCDDVTKFYLTITQQAQEKHQEYDTALQRYLNGLQEKGNSDLSAIVKQLIDFKNENEEGFLVWLQRMKDILGDDPLGELPKKINDLNEEVEEMQAMLLSGNVMARLLTDSGDYIVDSMGRPLLSSRPICKCN